MPASNFTGGFPYGLTVRNVPVAPAHANKVYYCDYTYGSDGNSGTLDRPFKTIDYALDKCASNRGDIIYLKPGHAESVASAGALAFDKAGVRVIGMGLGGLRPTITLTTANTASVTVTAANVTIENCIFVANFANIATCFTVSADDCSIIDCEFRDTSSILNFLSCVLTGTVDNGADGLRVIGCARTALAAGALAFVSILSNCDRARIIGNVIDSAGTGDVGHFMIMAAKVMKGAIIADNVLSVVGVSGATVGIFMTGSSATSTGVCARNYVASLDTTGALFCTATLTFSLFENYVTGDLAKSGLLWPAADTPS